MVSIIFLTYNHERFVLEALDGLLSQTYPWLDIVIADDASGDATADLIAETLAGHPHRADIRFVRNDRNLGGFGRGNFLNAFGLSCGEFVVIACGDDVMLPTFVDTMVATWQRDDVSLVTANAVYIDETSVDAGRRYVQDHVQVNESFEALAQNGANVVCFGAAMGFERALVTEFGWPPEYLTASDIMLPFYAYLAKGARFVREPLVKYRVHAGNTSMSLQIEASADVERLAVEERMFYGHLAHAFLMEAELDRLSAADPDRFAETARRIKPLVAIQATEMARKLVRTRIALNEVGVVRLDTSAHRR